MNPLSKLIIEISQMTPAEVSFRTYLKLKKKIGRFHNVPEVDFSKPAGRQAGPNPHQPGCTFFAVDSSFDDETQTIHQEICQKGALLEEANSLCRNEFFLFRKKRLSFPGEVNWLYKGKGKRSWPLAYFDKVNISGNGRPFDVRITWELNRHQHFYSLGRAYWLTSDEKYARTFVKHIESWTRQNPFQVGINWTSNLEVALRAISWLWAYHFFKRAEIAEDFWQKFLQTLYLHGNYIERYLTTHFNPNNHIIGEATGLMMLGLFFQGRELRERWLEKGLSILEKKMQCQVNSTGGSKEESLGYHRFVMELFTLVYILCQKNGIPLSDLFKGRLEKMYAFLASFLRPDGTAFEFGDYDDGRAFKLTSAAAGDWRPSLSTGAALFQRGDLRALAGHFHEESFWLLGQEGYETFQNLESESNHKFSYINQENGLCLMRAGEDKALLFDFGPLGIGKVCPHGHADALSIQLYWKGRDLLIDPGTYSYNGKPRWRNYFRGTSAHNTIVVDGEHQSTPNRTFRWLSIARSRLIDWFSGDYVDFARGGHDGYRRLSDPVTHERSILFIKPDYFILVDSLWAAAEHLYEQCFHFHSGEVSAGKDGAIFLSMGRRGLVIKPLDQGALNLEILKGSEKPIQGWISPAYDRRLPAPVVKYSERIKGTGVIPMVLFPVQGKKRLPACRVLCRNEETIFFKLSYAKFSDLFMFGNRSGQLQQAGGFGSDAQICFFRISKDEKVKKAFMVKGRRLLLSQDKVIEFEKPVQYAELREYENIPAVNAKPNIAFKIKSWQKE
jgi:hypothetical protein